MGLQKDGQDLVTQQPQPKRLTIQHAFLLTEFYSWHVRKVVYYPIT